MGFIVRICGLVIAISAITVGNYLKKKNKMEHLPIWSITVAIAGTVVFVLYDSIDIKATLENLYM